VYAGGLAVPGQMAEAGMVNWQTGFIEEGSDQGDPDPREFQGWRAFSHGRSFQTRPMGHRRKMNA
jgi:hypothetical protein